jgi:hypothetical protein
MMSVTETQFSGADVIVIAPDSTNLEVLQAAVLGADLRTRSDFAFEPGEARRLRLSAVSYDDAPLTLACPRPPACL